MNDRSFPESRASHESTPESIAPEVPPEWVAPEENLDAYDEFLSERGSSSAITEPRPYPWRATFAPGTRDELVPAAAERLAERPPGADVGSDSARPGGDDPPDAVVPIAASAHVTASARDGDAGEPHDALTVPVAAEPELLSPLAAPVVPAFTSVSNRGGDRSRSVDRPLLPVASPIAQPPSRFEQAQWERRRRRGTVIRGLALSAALVVAAAVGFVAGRAITDTPDHADVATLAVDSDPPGARVLIDGEFRGATPLLLSVAAGPRQLDVQTPGGNRRVALTLSAGERASHFFSFGGVRVAERPAAPLDVLAGGTATAASSVAPVPARPSNRGSISITSEPAGWSVMIAGTRRGVTPLTVADLEPGLHDVQLSHRGRSLLRKVLVNPGRTATLDVRVH